MIKLAAFDVDGTLQDRDYLPESTRAALNKLKQHGITLTLCTGRSEFEMKPLCERLGIDWAITCNGSHIGYRGQTIFGNPFPRDTVRRWLLEAERRNHALVLYGAEKMFLTNHDDPYFLQAQKEIGWASPLPLPPLDEVPDIYQCILFCTEQEEQAYLGTERDRCYLHRWRTWALDINPNGVNKALGLGRLLEHLRLSPEEAAAFGDGMNDLELLSSAGTGIAMGNAVEELKQIARYVTRTLHEDGIAYAVDRWILTENGGKG
jgi:hypothetical protein